MQKPATLMLPRKIKGIQKNPNIISRCVNRKGMLNVCIPQYDNTQEQENARLNENVKVWNELTSVILVNLPPGLLKPPLSPAPLWGG